jgi:CBS domain-containing protein
MRCEEAMTEEVQTIGLREPVWQAAQRMRDLDIGFLPVCQADGTPVGTLTDRDIVLRVIAEGRPASTAVEWVMTTELVCCAPEHDVAEAERLMRVHQVSRVIVIGEDGKVAGVISLADVARAEAEPGPTLVDIKQDTAPANTLM